MSYTAIAFILATVVFDQEPKSGATRVNDKGIELVYVPSGSFTMGSDMNRTEQPVRKVTLTGFWIGKNDVTVEQFRKFTEAANYTFFWAAFKPTWGWVDDNPMVNVTWEDARAYCKWAGGDLPTEAQWEKAARGTDGRQYPWGKDFDAHYAWWSKDGTAASAGSTASVGRFPKGASPYGCLDMSGNVWQWCLDWFSEDGYDAEDLKDPLGAPGGKGRAVRGGAWVINNPLMLRSSHRIGQLPTVRRHGVGFRLVSK